MFIMTTSSLFANELKALLTSGNKVHIEVIDIKDDINGEYEYFVRHLKDKEEWGRWNIVEESTDADFTCRLTLNNKMYMGNGGSIHAYIEIINNKGDVVWKSKVQKGRASAFTGFNAHGDAMRKIIRRAIKEELYNEEDNNE